MKIRDENEVFYFSCWGDEAAEALLLWSYGNTDETKDGFHILNGNL